MSAARYVRSASTLSPYAAWEASRRELLAGRKAKRHVRVAIVGGGIAGIEAARELRNCGVNDITIYEDRAVEHTVSHLAAGLIEPVAGTQDPAGGRLEAQLFARSMPAWRRLHRTIPSFVSIREVDTYCSGRRDPLTWADDVYGFRELSATELNPAYPDGGAARFSTFVVETARYLAAMRARAVWSGTKLIRRHIEDLDELTDYDAIVNASGLGAAKLANDQTMYRGDGHVIRVRPIKGVERVFMDETRSPEAIAADPLGVNMIYIIPRAQEIVIGGTLWDRFDLTGTPDLRPGMSKQLLELAANVEPRLAHAVPIAYRVGSRPRRTGGVRAELDLGRHVPVVHCYGQGGSGWTLAPALAETTIGLLAGAVWADAATG
jgi:D-amino-acid oxidase